MDAAVHSSSSFLAVQDLWSCIAPGFLASRGESELSHVWLACCYGWTLSALGRMLEGLTLGCQGEGR